MRVFVSADMEGATGIADPRDVVKSADDYDDGVSLLVADVNAAVAGALAAGADSVLVNDSHSTMTNLPRDALHEEARLIRGSSKRRSMMQGLDPDHDVAFFVGYHAKAGTPHAVLNHTFFPQALVRLRVDGIEVGELGWNAGLAAHYDVPVGLVTGDDKTAAEARAVLGDGQVETAVVKEGIDRFTADCRPASETSEAIRTAAERAVERCSDGAYSQPSREGTTAIAADWATTNQAYQAAGLPSVERESGRTTRVEKPTYPEAFEAAVAMLRAAGAGRNEWYG